MSDAFDPYYIWLGIPPEEQPPNHYRLLGVTLFEENAEVIEAAANRQMAYIQEISAGDDHIDQAQKIMGELSKARVCLLSAEKKKSYDTELRASFDTLDEARESTDASSPSAPTIATPNPPGGDGPLMPPPLGKTAGQEAPVTGVSQSQDGKTAKRSTRSASGKRKTKAPVRPGFLLAIIGLIAVVVAFVLFSGNPEDGSKVTQNNEPTQADENIQRLEQQVQELTAAQEAERKTKEEEEAKKKAKEEAERKAKEEAERKAAEEAERKAKEEAERQAQVKEEKVRKAKKVKEEKERKAQQDAAAAKRLKEDAKKYIKSKGFIFKAEDERWWPEASYPSYKEVEEEANSLNGNDLYDKDNKEFWRQISELLDKRKQIQSALDAANEPEFTTQLEILGQKPGEIPDISWLKGTATSFLQGQGLKEAGKNVWRLEEEAQLKQAKDAEGNLSSEMLANFNPAQKQLLARAYKEYRIVTKKEFDDLYNAGDKGNGDFGFGFDGNKDRGGTGWERFNFLAHHHPDCKAPITGPKQGTGPFEKEALQASLKILQDTPAWQKASRKRSKANTLQKKISNKYKKLQRSSEVEVALEVVSGQLPPTETKK